MNGRVYLVGAGPGDYGLITVKGLELLKRADVLVYDRLANSEYIGETKPGCELIYVGKASADHTMSQEDINRTLEKNAKEGKMVVRLKGGDPYVFGRGGEEGIHLREKGIEFEVVPGVTSAIGGLAYAGIPITHRGIATSLHVITGHKKEGDLDLEWDALARVRGTLVFLMGVKNLEKICKNLIACGKEPSTPAAIVSRASTSLQSTVTGTLEDICEKAVQNNVKPPSLIVIGEVVSLREELSFFEGRPLFGKKIVITRARSQASALSKRLQELGASVIQMPAIEIQKIMPDRGLSRAVDEISKYTCLVFTSTNGVEVFFEKLHEKGLDSRSLHGAKIAAIGDATQRELLKHGIRADIVPERFVSESLAEELSKVLNEDDRVLLPRARGARIILKEELDKICTVDEVATYEAVIPKEESDVNRQTMLSEKFDYITFTSSSTVTNFIWMIGSDNMHVLDGMKKVSIGPVTSKTAKSKGIDIDIEADEYNIDGIVKAILEDAGRN